MKALPALAYHFHLSPSDVWSMKVDEYEVFTAALIQLNKDLK